jgi:hypothetical protein
MLTLAVAALAFIAPARKQSGYILPLYDIVPSVDSGNNVTVNFMLSAPWNVSTNNYSNFHFFFANRYQAFTPNGGWNQITPYSWTPISGNQVTVSFAASQFNNNPTGTIWVMYTGGQNDSPNGAEASVAATNVWTGQDQGHGGRPGLIVPIKDVVPSDDPFGQNHTININFNIDTPYTGSFNNSVPTFFCNTGPGYSMFPGNGWQTLNTGNISATPGFTNVSVQGHPNANAGYYLAGSAEYYTPSESYNTHNYVMWEYSAIVRAFTGA